MHTPRRHGPGADPAGIRTRVTKMLEAGRVTQEEADRVLNAADPEELERAVVAIRMRHASVKFAKDVSEGRMMQEEADLALSRVQRGESPRDGL